LSQPMALWSKLKSAALLPHQELFFVNFRFLTITSERLGRPISQFTHVSIGNSRPIPTAIMYKTVILHHWH
jgi:hypothetical protein